MIDFATISEVAQASGLRESIVEALINYQRLAIFLGSFFFAESIILAASFLAAHGFWSVLTVFVFAFFGTVLCDLFWYFLGLPFLKITRQWALYEKAYTQVANFIERSTRGRTFQALLFIKFLYGTRFLTVVYLALQKIPFTTFLFYDAMGTMLWLAVVIPIGWLAGRGASGLISLYRNFNYVILAFLVTYLFFKAGGWLLHKMLIKRSDHGVA